MKPSHIAYDVINRDDKNSKGIWREVGAVWPHKNGSGFDVVVDVMGTRWRITCLERKELGEQEQE